MASRAQAGIIVGRIPGRVESRCTRRINFREGWRGHLWQERFASFPMDNSYLLAAARYVEMNPVAAGIVTHPAEYPWSSARAHLAAQDDQLAKVEPLLTMICNWKDLLSLPSEEEIDMFRKHERTGRPLGPSAFVEELEEHLGRVLCPQKPGPKLRAK